MRMRLILICMLMTMMSSSARAASPLDELTEPLKDSEGAVFPDNGLYESEHFVQMQNLGSDALVCRLHLFRTAEKTLDILTYIWNEDASGRFMMREAVKAAQRGVKVRILVDTIGAPEDLEMIAYFATAHPALEFKIYNPISNRVLPSKFHLYREVLFRFKKFNQRMHTKLIIADGRTAVTGGRNFGDEYFDVNDVHNFKDRDIMVIGPVVREMMWWFELYWSDRRSAPAGELIDVAKAIAALPPDFDPAARFYDYGNLFDDIERKAEDPDYIRSRFVETVFKVHRLMLVVDPPGKRPRSTLPGRGSRATRQLLSVVNTVEHSVMIQSPYFILNDHGIKVVRDRRKNNPNLDIVVSTNSLSATDSIYAYAYAFKRQKTYVHDLQVRTFEFKPIKTEVYTEKYLQNPDIERDAQAYVSPPDWEDGRYYASDRRRFMSIHAKSFVIDDKIAWIGSTNLDSRSLHWNTEIGVVVWDEAFARALKNDISSDISPFHSWTIAKRVKGLNVLRRAHEPLGTLMEHLPAIDIWPFHYTSAFELKKGEEPVAMTDPSFYDRYQDIGSFPLVSPLAKRHWRLRILKSLIGLMEPVL